MAVWEQALRDAVAGGSGELTTRHVLLALLAVQGGVAERVVQEVGTRSPAWLRGLLLSKVRRDGKGTPQPVELTDSVKGIVRRLHKQFQQDGVPAGELETLQAAVADESSRTIVELLQKLGCDRARLSEVIEKVGKGPEKGTSPASGSFRSE
jgi:ATP-dependent Clp protease ATP-binding subunit ClpA